MVYEEIACDYNYKCLYQGCINKKYTVVCPHLKNCDIFKRIQKIVSSHKGHSSCKKNKNGWDHKNTSKRDLREIFAESMREGFICPYCKSKMTFGIGYTNQVSIDHIVARALGGDNSKKNLVLCCKSCNRDKSRIEMKVYQINNKGMMSIGDIAEIK